VLKEYKANSWNLVLIIFNHSIINVLECLHIPSPLMMIVQVSKPQKYFDIVMVHNFTVAATVCGFLITVNQEFMMLVHRAGNKKDV
jgi:hypothetical protein